MVEHDAQNAGRGAADPDVFDLALVGNALLFALRAPLRHPVAAAFAFLVVFAASLVGILYFPQRYEVRTIILAGSPLSGALVEERPNEGNAPTRAAREILLRRENLEALARKTNLASRYIEARPPALRFVHAVIDTLKGEPRTPETVFASLVDTLEDRLWIVVYPEGTVSITFQWWDMLIAYDVVEAAAQSFLEMRHAADIQTVAEQIAILEQHEARLVKEIDERISAIEERVARERGNRRAVRPAVARPARRAENPELARVQAALESNQRALAALESARQQRALELQAELLRQQTIYAPDHPAIAATQRMLASVQGPSTELSALRAERQRLLAEMERLGAGAGQQAQVSTVSSMDSLQALFEEDPRGDYELALVRNLQDQLANISQRIAAARLERETAEAAFKHRYAIISPPRLPKGPAKPYALMFLFSGVVGGALFALVAAVALDLRKGTILERWQLEQYLRVPVLGRFDG